MNEKKAILAFSQGEKIKSGILWILQTLEVLNGLRIEDKLGAERIIKINIQLIAHEVRLANRVTERDAEWKEIEKAIDMAFVMINSGVAQEASFHLGNAVSKVAGICQNAMSYLQKQGLV